MALGEAEGGVAATAQVSGRERVLGKAISSFGLMESEVPGREGSSRSVTRC